MNDIEDSPATVEFPVKRGCPMHQPAQYPAFRDQKGPVKVRFWNGTEGLLFTRYEDIQAVLGSDKFSAVPTRKGFPTLSAARDAIAHSDLTFLRMDAPDHGYYRRMLTKEFMVKRVASMKPHIAQLVDELLTEMIRKGSPGDIVQDFSLPLTSRVITDLLGIPYADREFFNEQSRLKLVVSQDPSIALEAQRKTTAYLDKLLHERTADPGKYDDLIDRLVVEQVIPGHLSHDMAVRMCDLLMQAGHETTANQIALGVIEFLNNPDQLKKLRSDPSQLGKAMEELLRFSSIVQFNSTRVATADVDINGFLVRKDTGVCAVVPAANHDPAKFACPEVFDIERDAAQHLAFGFGAHQCLGQNLARAELDAVFSVIFDRLPNLKIAVDLDRLPFKIDSIVFGLESLPVTWG